MDASNREKGQLLSRGSMTKEELVFQITRAMHNGHSKLERFKAYQCIKGYFLDLEVEDLVGIATQYGISAIASEII